ncbi:MAG: hypothetical protein IPM79_08775 [Polyangiaceae bacterium]|jgi:hypothetical protein|nr:hypothetical protein [Polyangiaceae bacterium]MBK8937722.1 hypothetical protein [Polyangiaceae bacterium]
MTVSRFTRSTTFPRVDAGGGALLGDGFVSDALLEDWLRSGVATRFGAVMRLSDGRRFALTDGLRILGRRNGDSDPYGLTGCLMTLRSLLRRGGLVSHDGVRLGAAIYDVAFGVLAEPLARDEETTDPGVPPSALAPRGGSA